MTDTITSQITDLFTWITLYNPEGRNFRSTLYFKLCWRLQEKKV